MSVAPQPVFFLPLQYSNVDSISGIQPISYSATTPIPPTYTQGLYGQSAYFYNSTAPVGSNVCSTYDVSALNLKIFTVSMWYLPLLFDGVNSQSYIYMGDAGLYNSYTVFPFTNSATTGSFYMNLGFSVGIINLQLVLNKWAHLAYTINSSGNFILYMNGVQVRNVTMNQVGSYTTTTGSVTGSGGTVTLTVASLSTFISGMQISGLPSGYGTVTISSSPSGSSIVCSYGGASPTLISSGTAISNLIPGNTYTTSAFPNYIKYLVLGNQVYNARPSTVQIQDVRIYNSVLTPAQIYGIYQSQGIPPRITMVPASGGLPGPLLAFPFNGSNVESITGITPLAQYPITGNSALRGNAVYIKTAPTSNTALYCTGPYATSSNCMNLGTSSPANFDYNSSNLFCEFWWYTSNTTTTNLNTPISLGVIDTTSTSYRIQVRLNGGFQLNFSGQAAVANTTSLSASTWYHFAFSVDSTNKVIYPFVNGFGGVSGSYTGTLTYTSTDTLVLGYSNALAITYYYDQYIQDLRMVRGGIVPTTNFTPALPPYQYVLPSYVTGTGSIVLTLQSQFVNYTNGLLCAQAINFLSNAGALPATSNVTYNINPTLSTTSLTISAWINATTVAASPGQNMFLASYGQNGDGDVRWSCSRTGTTTYTISLAYNFVSGSWQTSTSASLTTGSWVHVAMTISGSAVSNVITSYVNGGFIGSQTSATRTNMTNLSKITVGSYCSGLYNSQFNGIVQDVRIYNQALTSAQIQTIYQSGGNLYGANTVQPSLLWSFNGTLQESVTGYKPGYPTGDTNPSGSSLSFTTGKYGQGLQFIPGTSYGFGLWDSVSSIKPLARTYFPYAGGMSVSFWYMPTSLATGGILFSTSAFNSLTPATYGMLDLIYIYLNTSGSIGLNTQATSGGAVPAFAVAMGTVAVNNWVHVTFGVDTQNIYMYINGVLTGTRAQPSNWATTDITSSGYWMGGMSVGTQHFAAINGSITGIMNDLRVYSSLLSAAQIYGIYQSGGIPPTATIVPTTGNLPSPAYAWQFEGTLQDSLTSATFTPTGTFAYVSGQYGQGINIQNPTFVSSNSMSLTISSPVSSANFTVCTWVNFVSLNNLGQGIFMNLCKAGQNNGIRFGLPSSSSGPSPQFIWYDDSNTNMTNTGSALSLNTWIHMAASFLNGTMTTYINGSVLGTAAGTAGINTYNTVILGNYVFNGFPIQNASIDDLRIFNSALTPTQIQTIYNSGGNLYGGNLVQPNYLWTFEGNLNEQVTGLSSTRGVNISYGPGKYGQGLASGGMSFYGGDSPIAPKLPLLSYSRGLTVAIWVYYTSSAGGYLFDIASFNSAVTSKFNDRIYGGPNPVTVNTQAPASGGGGFSFSYATLPNSWNHYVFSFNSTSFSFYLNGSLMGTRATPISWNPPTTDDVTYFGGNISTGMLTPDTTSSASGTTIDDFRVYNTALSAQQIQGIYLSGGAPPQARLTSG